MNHFHDDCLAGLPAFHRKGIPSYANYLPKTLAAEKGVPEPQHGFPCQWEFTNGDQKIASRFFGEAHTKDNIVTWIPSETILFGGFQVKSLGREKGNLADANTGAWSETSRRIKAAYKTARIVVAGHGNAGTTELLDNTIRLFGAGKKE